MRLLTSLITISVLFLITACSASQPQRTTDPSQPIASSAQIHGNLLQVMRGALYPDSNVIFAAQSQNPAELKPAADASTATDPLLSTYGGWTAVENSAIALAESANLLIIPGRKCANGLDAPLNNPDWAQFVQGLRDAGMTAYEAAKSKNQGNIIDAADAMATACANCHDKYRDVPGGDADRCK